MTVVVDDPLIARMSIRRALPLHESSRRLRELYPECPRVYGVAVMGDLSRRRWFGMSIVLASGSVMFLGVAFHLSMALVGALLVGAGAGMAFLAGTTLLYGEVDDAVRGRVFAVVQIGVRMVLLLAITLSGFLVGLGSSRRVDLGAVHFDVSSTRVLLLAGS